MYCKLHCNLLVIIFFCRAATDNPTCQAKLLANIKKVDLVIPGGDQAGASEQPKPIEAAIDLTTTMVTKAL